MSEVDVQAPAPGEHVGQQAAEQQADRRAGGRDRGEDAERLRTLGRVGERDGEQRQRRRGEQRAERALQRPGDHQDPEGRREPAEERGGGEADQAGDEGPLAPEEVADLAADEQQAAERERVGGDDPLAVLGREPKVLLRRGQRDVDDRRVEHDHELRDPEQREDGPAVGLGGGRRGGRHRSRVQSRILGPSGRRPRRRPSGRCTQPRTPCKGISHR